MASIVKRGRSYAVVYYEGVGKKRQQVWESGLSYTAAKSRKAEIELEQANSEQGTPDKKDMTGKNPFLNATLPEHQEKERAVLSPEQVLRVLKFTCRPEYYDYYMMHCAILIAVGCTLRGGEIGGLQWDRVYYDQQAMNIDRVIDRVSKKNMEKLSKMEIMYTFPNLYPGTKTTIVLK